MKQILLTIGLCLFNFYGIGQVTFEKIIAFPGQNFGANEILNTPGGGYIFCGVSFGGGNYLWAGKLDSEGEIEWLKRYGPPGAQYLTSITKDYKGGYMLLDDSWEGEVDTINNISLQMTQIDSLGNQHASKLFPKPGVQGGIGIVNSNDGGYVTLAEVGDEKLAVQFEFMKTDSNLNPVWTLQYGQEQNDWPLKLIKIRNGGYLAAGSTHRKYYNSSVSRKFMSLIKVSERGDTIWTFHLRNEPESCSFSTYLQDVVETRGGFIATGSGTFKVDQKGRLLWTNWEICGQNLTTTHDGGVLISHWGSLTKLNASGEIVWTRKMAPLEAYRLTRTPDNGFILMGQKTDSVTGLWNLHIIKLNCKGRLEPDSSCLPNLPISTPPSAPTITISPNPLTNSSPLSLTILNYPEGSQFTLELFDLMGRLVKTEKKIPIGQTIIPVTGLSPGKYIYRLLHDTQELKHGKILVYPW